MDIFITWSGRRSLGVAQTLKEYLPMIANVFKPWLSEDDINKGANWASELTSALNSARAGIVCVTPSNLNAPWLLWEAGAIAKSVTEKPLACTLLIGLKSIDLYGPLALFQATQPTRDDLLKLIKTLNSAAGKDGISEAQLQKAFGHFWPEVSERLTNLPSDGSTERPHRTEREMLEELVNSARDDLKNGVLLAQAQKQLTQLIVRVERAETLLGFERERSRLQSQTNQDAIARLAGFNGIARPAGGISTVVPDPPKPNFDDEHPLREMSRKPQSVE